MEKVSSARIALKWGLIYGIVSIVVALVSYNTDLWKNWIVSLLVTVILFFGVMYFSLSEYKSLNGGFMTFGQGFGLGMLTIFTGGLISIIFDFSYKKYIDPNLIDMQLEMTREQYESMGMSEEQIEMALEKAQSYMSSGMAVLFGMISILVIGLIVSLIMSAVLKKDKPVFS
ncbi:MAG: DUF4199 domain-containing protein [Cytophagaceae bacterium]|nr:DUF4199 domain-containing protein [Cytophagaceae bacterium]MBK9508383.1 DUF4199 domain-containing protein [Cytophagaceae bacterium]MBK9932817.1 DUF4199 domain-containing protein [Cytophagaceae bacterium]MBL0303493.1 DUF4199 domain-containing protein [Cytophagaceae bacterium]MBL0326319.1 DUF4199 domain-containing protein [Cytophagaceae bacterium]